MNSRPGNQQQQSQPLRGMNMASYAPQPGSRQTPRLQNTPKTGLGNGNAGAGWAFGAPSSTGFNIGAPGLGQARPGQLSGFAQVMGGGGGQGPIDMSDFPSLSGGRTQQPSSNFTGGWNSNVIRQPTSQQVAQPLPQQRAPSTAPSHQSTDQFDNQRSQQSTSERSGDEFPPLGGQLNGDSLRQNTGLGGNISSSDDDGQLTMGETQLPIREPPGAYQQHQGGPTGQPQLLQDPPTQPTQPSQPAPDIMPWGEMKAHDEWGLQGLLAQLEARRATETGAPVDETMPSHIRRTAPLIVDFPTHDINLDSSDPIYPTFSPFGFLSGSGSMYDSRDRPPIPSFALPNSYAVNNVPPMEARMSAFSDETLFNIFYQYPRDIRQEQASAELSARDWRWHKVLHQWLQKDTREANGGVGNIGGAGGSAGASSVQITDLVGNATPVGAMPTRIDEHTERGVYIFFNAEKWRRERREFILDYEQLDHRVVSPSNLAAAAAVAPGMNGPFSSAAAAAAAAQGVSFGANPGMPPTSSGPMTGSGPSRPPGNPQFPHRP